MGKYVRNDGAIRVERVSNLPFAMPALLPCGYAVAEPESG